MARPITWQDVAGPAQTPGLLLAGQRAGEQLVNAFSGIGDTIRNVGDVQKKAATEAAIASIANSEDPAAAASAVPQGWQFDPLAIAGAKNARTGQLLDTKVKNSNLRENEAQIDDLLSQKQDRESARLIASKVAPYIDLARAGKEYEFDQTDPFWQTKAGFDGLKYLDTVRAEGEGQRNELARLGLERQRVAQAGVSARLAQEQLSLIKARQETDDKFVTWLATPEGIKASPQEKLRVGRALGEATGAGASYGAAVGSKQNVQFGATPEGMAQNSPQGPTYKDAATAVAGLQLALEENQLVQDNLTNLSLADFTAMEKNDYAGMSESALNDAVLKNNPEFADGALWTSTDWEEIQQRRDAQRNFAAKEGREMAKAKGWKLPDDFNSFLLPEQEANLVELTKGNVWMDGADSPAAKRLRQQYVAVNITGGLPAAKKRLANEQALTQRDIGTLQQLSREIEAAQVAGRPLPAAALKAWNLSPAGQARAKVMLELQGLSK